MTENEAGSITGLMIRLRNGDVSVRDELIRRLECQMLPVAESLLGDSTLGPKNPTNQIVREAISEALTSDQLNANPNRRDLIGSVTRIIRQQVFGRARTHSANTTEHDRTPMPLTEINRIEDQPTVIGLIELNDAIESLSQVYQRASEVITLRYLAGYTVDQAAAALGVSSDVVEMDWRFARAWILRFLQSAGTPDSNLQDG